ncbi:MAG TPA: DUF4340 domain-containing protein [Chitinispirillaceae bacterium]|jgi:hypothetical protein|nr:DUF4340 domain-containing protein [Chitinispirillaceae bacterium]
MNGKKLLVITGILVVAVLVIILSEKLTNSSPSSKSALFFPGMTEKDISSVTIKDSNGSVKIRRKGDIWVVSSVVAADKDSTESPVGETKTPASSDVEEWAADSASVAAVLEKLTSMKKDELISENPEKQAIFEVDSTSGVLVDVFDAGSKLKGSFRIGKNGPDWSSNYVRMIGSNSVYMVKGSIKYSFFTELKRWRDKSIVKFDKESASKISLKRKDGTVLTVAKADTAWSITEPFASPAKKDQIDQLLNSLSRLTATDFETTSDDSALGLLNPELSADIAFSNGSSKKVIFGTKDSANRYRVKAEGKDVVFLINEYEFNNINKDAASLKEEVAADTTSETKK